MTRPNKRQRDWSRNVVANHSGAPLNDDPFLERRRELWDRALAENIPPEVAARMVAAILRAEDAAMKADLMKGARRAA